MYRKDTNYVHCRQPHDVNNYRVVRMHLTLGSLPKYIRYFPKITLIFADQILAI
jgi:hypothetical protein